MTLEPYIEVENLLPLTRYAQLMHLDIGHILQVGGAGYPEMPACSRCWTEDMRQTLRQAIATAEGIIAEQIGYPVGPTYIVQDEKFPWHYRWSPVLATVYRRQIGRGGWPTLEANWKHLLTLGSVLLVAVDDPKFIWSCPDGEGINTIGTVAVHDAARAIDPHRIRVFHAESGVEIRGLRVRRIGNNWELSGFRPLWVTPDACGFGESCVDWEDNKNFVATVADLEVFEEEDQEEDALCYIWSVDECGAVCTPVTQRGCAVIVNRRAGIVQGYPATWDGETLAPGCASRSYPPDRYILRYRAGWVDGLRRPGHHYTSIRNYEYLGARMAQAIVRLANTLLPEDTRCGCEQAQNIWRQDKMLVGFSSAKGASSSSRPAIEESHRCPFGPTYGALAAWRIIKPLIVNGVVVI